MEGTTPRPWDQLAGEPSRHYQRFHDHFLLKGPERSLEEAWRESQRASEGPRRHQPSRPSGAFKQIAKTWDWLARAEAWDVEQRRLAKIARDAAIEKAQITHEKIATAGVNSVAGAFRSVKWDGMRPLEWFRAAREAIDLQRKVYGEPMLTATTRAAQETEQSTASQATIPNVDLTRFVASPEMHAAVCTILDQCEHKSNLETPSDDPEPPGEPLAVEPAPEVAPDPGATITSHEASDPNES